MLDHAILSALAADPAELAKLANLVNSRGSVPDRIRKSSIGATLSGLSARLGQEDDVEPILSDIADLFPLESVLIILKEELAGYKQSDLYNLLAIPIQNEVLSGFQIWSDRNVAITVTTISPLDKRLRDDRRARRSKTAPLGVSINAADIYLRFLKAGPTHMIRWRSELIGFETAISNDRSCRQAEEIVVSAGDSVFVRGGEESWTFTEIPEGVLTIGITCKRFRSPVGVQFDKDSLQIDSASAADDKSSRIQLLSTFLRSINGAESKDHLASLLDHRDHYVRWYVARELIAADPEAAVPHIHALRNDPHPQVAAAAKATLELMEGEA